jgi:predicted phosphohydrolase
VLTIADRRDRLLHMRVLITADLHYRRKWFEWLIREATQFDAVFIAGDFLDIFIAEPRSLQASEAQQWLRRLAEVTKVAICSGNHDNAGHQVVWDRAPIYQWMAELGQLPNLITDGCTRLMDDIIITTVPYYCSRDQKGIWLDRGASIRKQRPGTWMVLHHVPPDLGDKPLGEEREAREILETYRPDYFISGHIHQLPYLPGNSWVREIGGVKLIAPGQLLGAPIPNHVILELPSGQASWVTSSETWIAEAEPIEHLVLKIPRVDHREE